MGKVIRDEEARAVLALPAAERYEHAVKQMVDREEVWGLKDDSGWLLLGDSDGQELFPIWPHERYAAEYARARKTGETPAPIALSDWLEDWLPRFTADNVAVAVFPLPTGAGIPVSPAMLEHDMRRELEWYD